MVCVKKKFVILYNRIIDIKYVSMLYLCVCIKYQYKTMEKTFHHY